MITVGLLWHSFSSDNLGVGALSESQVAICQAAAQRAGVNLRFVVYGFDGSRDYAPKGIDIRRGPPVSLKQMLLGRSAFVKDIASCDLVLDIGEGDSFADIYGMRRFRTHIATKLAVLRSGVPLILSPQTIGPFEGWLPRWVATQVMKRCTQVFARDGMSTDYVQRELGLTDVAEAIDVAFRLPFTPPKPRTGGPVRVGVNVSGLLYSGGYAGNNQFGLSIDYRTHVRQLLEHWSPEEGVEVWLIPHVLSDALPRDDDRVAIAELALDFPKIRIAPSFESPSAAKSFIASMDFMTGARMHACIAAFSSGVPVVPLAYSRKFNGLFSSLGYDALADGKALTTEQATQAVLDGFRNRALLKHTIHTGMEEAAERLMRYENVLTELFLTIDRKWPG